jgi:DNA-binding NarL/FixJ family response regulator
VATTLALADDHEPFRRCIAALLAQEPGLTVVAEFDSGEALVAALQATSGQTVPDVLVIDVSMRGIGGPEATRQALALQPRVRVLALSMHDEPQIVKAMRDAGALGYVLKEDPFPDLVQALRDVALGRTAFSRSITPI